MKVVDIERLKNAYYHRVGTQFDNAIFVAENEFLIDAYTKADMVAMLTEIQLEIEECVDGAEGSPQFEQGVSIARVQVVEIIQQKINELKADQDRGKNNLSSELEKKLEKEVIKNDLGVDCVSRADVNQVIEEYMDEQYHVLSDRTRERAFGAKVVKARINELPSVTPIRPKGHWITRNAYLLKYKCSECNYKSERYNFCPNCGADMREVEE